MAGRSGGGDKVAMLTGFAGVRVRGGVLEIRPSLPARWPRLDLSFRCLGRRIGLAVDQDRGWDGWPVTIRLVISGSAIRSLE